MKKLNKTTINILLLFIGVLFYGCNTEEDSTTNSSTNTVVNTNQTTISTQLQNEYLLELNKARSIPQDCGSEGIYYKAVALKWNNKLYGAAHEHSDDMAISNTFSHTGSGEASDKTGVRLGKSSEFDERIAAYGYSHSLIGENIASGTNTDTAKKVVAQLMKSDGHCANIMHPDFREVGMAMSKNSNSKYVHYWTQNFGRSR